MKTLIRQAIETLIKSQLRQAEKYKHKPTIYKALEEEINQLKEIDNKIAQIPETQLDKFLKEKGA